MQGGNSREEENKGKSLGEYVLVWQRREARAADNMIFSAALRLHPSVFFLSRAHFFAFIRIRYARRLATVLLGLP